MSALNVFGLFLDIAGVLFLGFAFAGMPDKAIQDQAGTYWDCSFYLLHALVVQRTDAWIGLPILVLGFIFQALGSMGVSVSDQGLLTLWGLAIASTGACLSGRGVANQRVYERLKSDLDDQKEPKPTLKSGGFMNE